MLDEVLSELPLRRRIVGVGVLLSELLLVGAVFATGDVWRRLSIVPVLALFGAAVLAVPSAFVLTLVRSRLSYCTWFVATAVAIPRGFIAAETSESSTAGILLLLIPYVSSLVALIGAVFDAVLRHLPTSKSHP